MNAFKFTRPDRGKFLRSINNLENDVNGHSIYHDIDPFTQFKQMQLQKVHTDLSGAHYKEAEQSSQQSINLKINEADNLVFGNLGNQAISKISSKVEPFKY